MKKSKSGTSAGVRNSISPLMTSVASYIARAGKKPLPKMVTEATKHHLVDTLAAMISGSRLVPGKKAIAYVKTLGGTREACVPGSRIVTSVVHAALAGGMFAHADETDDSHAPSHTHPGCGIVPAALAMAERERAGGTTLLRAVALGYDICARMGLSVGGRSLSKTGRDGHNVGGAFGAAAAAAALAGLSADQVRYVLSYTAQQVAGVSHYARDAEHVEKAFLFGGMPARNGVYAATMVASGFSGVPDAFSGDRNFFLSYGANSRPEEVLRELGEVFEVVNSDIKRWPVGNPIQALLDSLYVLIKNHKLKAADVQKAVLRVSHQGAYVVNDRNMPDISAQHLAAVMLLDGTVTFASAHDKQRMRDAKVVALRPRIKLYGDDELERAMPVRQGIVELTLRDGRELRHHTKFVRGRPHNPMTREEIDEKAFPLIATVLGKPRARKLCDAVWNIENIKDMRKLRPLLQGHSAQ